jgi:hypothetical protein
MKHQNHLSSALGLLSQPAQLGLEHNAANSILGLLSLLAQRGLEHNAAIKIAITLLPQNAFPAKSKSSLDEKTAQ